MDRRRKRLSSATPPDIDNRVPSASVSSQLAGFSILVAVLASNADSLGIGPACSPARIQASLNVKCRTGRFMVCDKVDQPIGARRMTE